MKKKVFLGGTCNDSTWRDDLIPLLTSVDFFHPMDSNEWTIEQYDEELRQRNSCDFRLYTITPKMLGVYSIAEVVDDSNKHGDTVLFLTLMLDEDDEFDRHQWQSMEAVAKMVKENGGNVFSSIPEVADWLNRQ